jgi:hypothetical protein
MINVLFSIGCYGTYLSRCIYNYTNLRSEEFCPLTFDSAGSSHEHRQNTIAKQLVWTGHLKTFNPTISDQTIIVLPNLSHWLDYYNNQFHKNQNQQLVEYILSHLSTTDINCKLKDGWGYNKPFDITVPRWILREFFSLWIADCLTTVYSKEQYNNITNQITIDTQDIILNFNETLDAICQKCNLTLTVDLEIITQTHDRFIASQHYLNSQLNCQAWVTDTILDKNSLSPARTIFDEAYIQHIFRTHGYEIECDGLNDFPTLSTDLKKIIYKV